MASQSQIIATIGPAIRDAATLATLMQKGVDVFRINCAWADVPMHTAEIAAIREAATQAQKQPRIILDLPGPRVQTGETHTFDAAALELLTQRDREYVRFGVEQGVDYFALSFVRSAADVEAMKKEIVLRDGTQKIIAKIERREAVLAINEIVAAADAVMIARGDLGNQVPVEQIPFIERSIIASCKKAGKPVIVATQMLVSMVDSKEPTRAEVTDIAYAITLGADAVMLSEETARGAHPADAVAMMERIVLEAERNTPPDVHPL